MRPVHAGKKRDANEPAIIAALRAVGATVELLSGPDVPDLLVGYAGLNWLLEVKTPKGALRANQLDWHAVWEGNVHVARTPDEALEAIGCKATRK